MKIKNWNKLYTYLLVVFIVIAVFAVITKWVYAGDFQRRNDIQEDYYSTFVKNIRFYTIYDGEHVDCIRFPELNNAVTCRALR